MNKMPIGFRIYRFIYSPIFKLYYNPKVINKEVIPKNGPIIIAGNHKNYMDQCMTIISTKRFLKYLAKKEYFDNKMLAWFFRSAGCIPVDRQNKNPKAKKEALEWLNSEGAIGIFPEGTRNKTNELLLPFKFGAVSMAQKTNATIVPFAIRGTYKFRSRDLEIEFGKPFKINNMDLEKANVKLYNEIKKLLLKK